jgi:hypothetical protein
VATRQLHRHPVDRQLLGDGRARRGRLFPRPRARGVPACRRPWLR